MTARPRFGPSNTDQDQPLQLDFDLAIYDAETNEWSDVTFTRRRAVPLRQLGRLSEQAVELTSGRMKGSMTDQIDALDRLFAGLLDGPSAQRLSTYINDEDRYTVDLPAMGGAIEWCLGEMAGGRPTLRRPASSGGSAQSGDLSEESLPSQDTPTLT